AALRREAEACPLAPRAGVELCLAAGQREPMDEHGGGDARAAVRDDLAGRDLRQRLVPRGVTGTGNVPGDRVDRLDVAAIALRDAGVERNDLAEALLQLVGLDRAARPAAGG